MCAEPSKILGKKPRGRRARNKRSEEKEEQIKKGPRDTKVVLVNQLFFSSVQQPDDCALRITAGISFSVEEFPDLSRDAVGSPPLPPLTSKWGAKKDPFPCLQPKTKHHDEEIVKESATSIGEQPPNMTTPKIKERESCGNSNAETSDTPNSAGTNAISTKKKKSKGPIVIALTSALKVKKRVKGSKWLLKRKKNPTERIAGNILDSSNPIRSKGKFRPAKRKRLSKLKTEIIKDRIIKTLSLKENEKTDKSRMDFKKEIETYLENLMKVRNEHRLEADKKPAVIKEKRKEVKAAPPGDMVLKHEFSSKFRWYSENVLTAELDESVKLLIQGLVHLQDRAFVRDPQKARMRKRHLVGFREVAKYLRLRKMKLLVIAPDLEASNPEGPVSKTVINLKKDAAELSVPCIFALNRRKLGYLTLKKVPVSVLGVLSYDGLEDSYDSVMVCFEKAKQIFIEKFGENIEKNSTEEDVTRSLLERLNLSSEYIEKNSSHVTEEVKDAVK